MSVADWRARAVPVAPTCEVSDPTTNLRRLSKPRNRRRPHVREPRPRPGRLRSEQQPQGWRETTAFGSRSSYSHVLHERVQRPGASGPETGCHGDAGPGDQESKPESSPRPRGSRPRPIRSESPVPGREPGRLEYHPARRSSPRPTVSVIAAAPIKADPKSRPSKMKGNGNMCSESTESTPTAARQTASAKSGGHMAQDRQRPERHRMGHHPDPIRDQVEQDQCHHELGQQGSQLGQNPARVAAGRAAWMDSIHETRTHRSPANGRGPDRSARDGKKPDPRITAKARMTTRTTAIRQRFTPSLLLGPAGCLSRSIIHSVAGAPIRISASKTGRLSAAERDSPRRDRARGRGDRRARRRGDQTRGPLHEPGHREIGRPSAQAADHGSEQPGAFSCGQGKQQVPAQSVATSPAGAGPATASARG